MRGSMESGRMHPSVHAALIGIVAAGPALAILLLARVGGGAPGILEVTADAVVRSIPPWIFDWGLRTLGPVAKGTLFGIVCLGVPLVGAATAVALERAHLLGHGRPAIEAVAAALTVLAVGELVVLPVAGADLAGSALISAPSAVHGPLVLASIVFGMVAAAIASAQGPARASSEPAVVEPRRRDLEGAPPVSRRRFLARSLVAAGIGSYAVAGVGLVTRFGGTTRSSVPGEPDLAGVEGYGFQRAVTPADRLYIVSKDYATLAIDPAVWRLSVTGLVDTPREWALDEIRALPRREGYRTLQCISAESITRTELIGNQRWEGVRVRDVLDTAGVHDAAAYVIWRCADGYHESSDLPTALDDDTWLVYGMGPPGTPLPAEHGAPLRLLVAGRYGMAQPKYLTGMILTDDDEPGWWAAAGWRTDAPVRTYCRIDLPAADGVSDAVVAGTTFTAYGVASSGDRGISAVQVSTDAGTTWRDAELEPYGDPIGRLTWVRWRAPVTLTAPGTLLFMARAADGSGTWQDAADEPPFPRGASGYPRVPMRIYPAVAGAAA